MVIVTEQPIDPSIIYEKLDTSGGGSAIYHYAVVRGRTGEQETTGIMFERSGDMEAELEGMAGTSRNSSPWTTRFSSAAWAQCRRDTSSRSWPCAPRAAPTRSRAASTAWKCSRR